MPPAHAIQPAEPGLDERSLRAAFGRFTTGVAFVTTEIDGTPLGLIVSSFAAVSLQPPLVSFCPSRHSITWQRMRHAGRCTINIVARVRRLRVSADAQPLVYFAGRFGDFQTH